MKEQGILQWMSRMGRSWPETQLPFNINLPFMQLTEIHKQLATSPSQKHSVAHLFLKKYFLLFGFIPLWDAHLSTWGQPDELCQIAPTMVFPSLDEMELPDANHFSPVPCPVPCCPTSWHTKLSLLEQPAFTWAYSGQAVVSPANSHSCYLHCLHSSKSWGKSQFILQQHALACATFRWVWSRVSYFASVKSRPKLYLTLTVAKSLYKTQISGAFSKLFIKLFIVQLP